MSKITKLLVKNFLGVEELGLAPGKINIFKGPMGSGKSSVIEAIEKGFTNNSRRTEVVRHGADEATLFIELDSGLEIDRRIRSERSDYLKVRKENEYVPSTERFLRSLISGEIFKPVEWLRKDSKEQTKSILNMIEIHWKEENIVSWFGELTYNIDYRNHILKVLKDIELKYYSDREEVNREIKELRTRMSLLTKDMPPGYDGEMWRDIRLQEYYNKIREAEEINRNIKEAAAFRENLGHKIKAIEAEAESARSKVRLEFNEQRSDIKDFIEHSRHKIQKATAVFNNLEQSYEVGIKEIEGKVQKEKSSLELELSEKLQALKDQYAEKISLLYKQGEEEKIKLKKEVEVTKEEAAELIGINENKIASREASILSLDKIEAAALEAVESRKHSQIEKEELRGGKAADFLQSNAPVDIEPLQRKADEAAEMQSYLRFWDNLIEIRDVKLPEKEKYASWLTANIEKARTLPGELLKSAKMPLEDISLDEGGLIRVKGTLIDGLSDGEKLELAMKIARAQSGELKVICIDRWESLNEKTRKRLSEEMEKDDFQYFVTVADDTQENNVVVEIEN
jgi:hypothetical protein